MSRSSICLNMIVKDEAHVIERCLRSVLSLIDRWVIVDTGSSDGTQDIIRRFLRDVPGQLVERPWTGFGPNRSEAIALAAGAGDYLLLIDADDMLVVEPGFEVPTLVADAYDLEIRHVNLVHRRICLIRNGLAWRYEGVLHEYLVCDHPYSQAQLRGPYMQIVGGGARSKEGARTKYARDATLLETAFAKEPANTRYAFYLAQSYRDSDQLEAALRAYEHRAAMPGGFVEETYLSLLWAARLALRLHRPQPEVVDRFLRAYEFRPARSEAIVGLMQYLRQSGPRWPFAFLLGLRAVDMPPTTDILFVEPEWQEWRALDEFAIAAYWVGEHEHCRRACERLLGSGRLPAEHRQRVLANLNFARAALQLPAV